jgi:dolichol-phosphate mannosyltransferase
VNISIVVPMFNEELRIRDVLEGLLNEFDEVLNEIIVIDDCSTDKSAEILQSFVSENSRYKVHRNDRNLGHGPSVIKGLNLALQEGVSHILTYDGDGFINQSELHKAIDASHMRGGGDLVVEIVRTGRSDPIYRRLVTFSLRVLVLLVTRKSASDPNSPSRLIPLSVLREYLSTTADLNPVPNLWFTIFIRLKDLPTSQIKVAVEVEPMLSTRNSWNSKRRIIPSRRFVLFCFRAIRFWNWKRS